MRKEYYNRSGIIVRDSTTQDVEYLKTRLRTSDQMEIWASNHVLPEQALKEASEKSIFCCTVTNGNPIYMFGLNAESVLGDKAIVWMLASDDLYKIAFRFMKNSRYFIDMMLQWYPYLYNYVDVRNKKSIEWLKMIGAKMGKPEPYGVEGKLFRYFYFESK